MLYTFTSYSSLYELYVGLLRAIISVAIGLSVLVSIDRLWHVLKCAAVVCKAKLTGSKPEDAFRPQALPDVVLDWQHYPMVAIQLPMFNERAVCQAIIDSACEQHWPASRLKIQVGPCMQHLLLLPALAGAICAYSDAWVFCIRGQTACKFGGCPFVHGQGACNLPCINAQVNQAMACIFRCTCKHKRAVA